MLLGKFKVVAGFIGFIEAVFMWVVDFVCCCAVVLVLGLSGGALMWLLLWEIDCGFLAIGVDLGVCLDLVLGFLVGLV